MIVVAIRSGYKALRAKLETKKNRRFTYREVSALVSIPEPTLIRFANNKVQSVRYDTLEKLLKFFRGQGIVCDMNDLLIET